MSILFKLYSNQSYNRIMFIAFHFYIAQTNFQRKVPVTTDFYHLHLSPIVIPPALSGVHYLSLLIIYCCY